MFSSAGLSCKIFVFVNNFINFIVIKLKILLKETELDLPYWAHGRFPPRLASPALDWALRPGTAAEMLVEPLRTETGCRNRQLKDMCWQLIILLTKLEYSCGNYFFSWLVWPLADPEGGEGWPAPSEIRSGDYWKWFHRKKILEPKNVTEKKFWI